MYDLKLHLSKNTILFVVKAILWNSKATSEIFEYLRYFYTKTKLIQATPLQTETFLRAPSFLFKKPIIYHQEIEIWRSKCCKFPFYWWAHTWCARWRCEAGLTWVQQEQGDLEICILQPWILSSPTIAKEKASRLLLDEQNWITQTAIIMFLAGIWSPTPVASRAHMTRRRQPRQQGQNN